MLNQIVHFLKIDPHWLDVDATYDFPLFFRSINQTKRFNCLVPGQAISESLYKQMLEFYNKGAIFEFPREFLGEFILKFSQYESNFNDLNGADLELEQLYFIRHFEQQKNQVSEKELIISSFENNNFMKLISFVKNEIFLFDPFQNSEVSTLWREIEKLMTTDTRLNRQVAIAFILSKKLKYSQQDQASLIFATYFRDLGLSQIAFKDLLNQDDDFIKHPFYSLFLLSKQNFEFSQLTKRIILEHHERLDGTGQPRGKKEMMIHPISRILAIIDESKNEIKDGNLSAFISKINSLDRGFDIDVKSKLLALVAKDF